MRVAIAAFALALLAPARAYAVEDGDQDTYDTFSVAIATGGPAAPAVRCTGTLVSPNVVLTVRHCVAGESAASDRCEAPFPDPPGAPSDLWVSTGNVVAPSLGWKNVSSWVLPTPNQPCGADVALLVLSTPVTAAEAQPAMLTLTADDFRAAAQLRGLGIAGFGASSPAGTDAGTRRRRGIPIRCVPGDPAFACEGGLEGVDSTEFTSGDGPCTGDSGAGAIVTGTPIVIFGILSRGTTGGGACGNGIFERTDVWRWLIAKTVIEATPATEAPPAWASALFPVAPKVGELCRGDACGEDASCVSFDNERSYECAAHCDQGCAAGTHCDGANNVCTPDGPVTDPGGGCSAAPHATPNAWLLVLLTGLLYRAGAASRRRSAEAAAAARSRRRAR